jgi:DNA ligase-1
MINLFEPMHAGEYFEEDILFPVWGMSKLDGIRGIVQRGIEQPSIGAVLYSKSLKPIRNKYTQELFGRLAYEGFDGELIVGKATYKDVARTTVSGIMSIHGSPDVTFNVFDIMLPANHALDSYQQRYEVLRTLVQQIHQQDPDSKINLMEYTVLNSIDDLQRFEDRCLQQGYEGIVLRHPQGIYLPGKTSTISYGGFVKKKLFKDSEAEIIGYVELIRNNKKETNVPGNTLGALIVRDIYTNQEFELGTGFTKLDRQIIWNNRDQYLEKIVKYKFFPIGIKDKPRHPSFLSFRDKDDLRYNTKI